VAVLNEGTYAAVTMSVQNTALAGASGAYGSLSQIAAVTVSTASGTSNKISDLTVTGNLARTGNAPLYLNNTTVGGNVTLAGTAYTEIRDSSIQDGSITVSGASTLLIEDSKIGTSTFNTAGSAIALRNGTIDPGDTVTFGPGVVYSLSGTTGNVVRDPAAINVEDALVAAGLSATQAEGAVTTHFHHIRMHNADVELNPTQVVTRDPVTGELEVSNISDIIPDGCCVPAGGTDGQVLTIDENGDAVWETPTGGTAAAPIHERDVKIATAGMTSHTLPDTPIGKVIVTRNGVDISDAWTWVDGVGTYNPANNYGCVIDAGDKIIFHYEKGVPAVTDKIAAGLSTSLTAYNAAADGTWVEITEAEYAAIQTSVAGVTKAGQLDSPALYTSTYEFGDMGFGNTATTTPAAEAAGVTGAIPANSWMYAYQYKTGGPASNRTYYLQLGTKGSNSGFASVMPAISNTTNAGSQLKSYIYKGGVFVPTTKDIASIGGTISYAGIPNHTSWWAGGSANSVPASISTYGNVWDGGSGGAIQQAQFQQVLTTTTKQW
jgi:hypothetical protein